MKISAMFLPQFHRDPLNSQWWGEGFTEWDNVRRARPLFDGHDQPREPLEGYFDLTDAGELASQARLARAFGISAFTFYDYWYEGQRILEKPLELFLADRSIDIAFSLCWANHSWTRSWTNRTGALDVLIEQTYAQHENGRRLHFDHLARAFADPRYIRIEGKPLLQIYNAAAVPDGYLMEMRAHIERTLGVGLHLDAFVTAWSSSWNFLSQFDSATLFQPSAALFSPLNLFGANGSTVTFETRLRAAPIWIRRLIYLLMDRLPDKYNTYDFGQVWDDLCAQYVQSASSSNLPLNPMGFVDFDNTARYGRRAKIMKNNDVEIFREGLKRLIDAAKLTDNIGYLFVNAWNEWGEGAYLQPDVRTKFSRLEAIKEAGNRA